MTRLIIIGARALGREVCNYARDAGFEVAGFLDDKADALDGFVGYPSILGAVDDYEISYDDLFVCAIGDSAMREKFATPIINKGGRFVNVVHPSAYVGPNVKMGVGCIICPQAVVDCDLNMGNHVIINSLSYVSHDSVLEDYVTLSPGCHLGGLAHLRKRVFMGIHACTIPSVELGDGAYVAAGACVTKSFEGGCLIGVPAVQR